MVQDETQTKTQCYEYFVYFFSYFVSFTLKSRTNVILINIIVCKSFKKTSIVTFVKSKQEENTHVLYTTANQVKWRPRRDHDGNSGHVGEAIINNYCMIGLL